MGAWFDKLLLDALRNDTQIILFAMLLVVTVIVLDALTKVAKLHRKKAGINFQQVASALPGKNLIEVNDFVSKKLQLAGKPDGLLIENGFTIPVEFKPLAKKIRDRYIIQILVYLRLIEEQTGKRPPYGYLILGKNSRQVKIYNSEKKQQNLKLMVETMTAIYKTTASAKAEPLKFKCEKCSAKDSCKFKII